MNCPHGLSDQRSCAACLGRDVGDEPYGSPLRSYWTRGGDLVVAERDWQCDACLAAAREWPLPGEGIIVAARECTCATAGPRFVAAVVVRQPSPVDARQMVGLPLADVRRLAGERGYVQGPA